MAVHDPSADASIIQRLRAACDAHGIPVPGFDPLGDVDRDDLLAGLATLGWRDGGERRTVDGAWRATLAAPDGQEVAGEGWSRERALCTAALAALEGAAV